MRTQTSSTKSTKRSATARSNGTSGQKAKASRAEEGERIFDLLIADHRLVAATDQGTVLEINPATGATSDLGAYGNAAGGLIRSSGDIVAISGAGIFATVTIGDTLTDPDYLASINPATWQATPLGIGTGYDRIFGLGYWRGKVFGFVDRNANGGAIVEINPSTGAATMINAGAVRWYGAGVTTDAPIIP
jgi:hypothetical protein